MPSRTRIILETVPGKIFPMTYIYNSPTRAANYIVEALDSAALRKVWNTPEVPKWKRLVELCKLLPPKSVKLSVVREPRYKKGKPLSVKLREEMQKRIDNAVERPVWRVRPYTGGARLRIERDDILRPVPDNVVYERLG